MTSKHLFVRDAKGSFVPADDSAVVEAAKSYLSRRLNRVNALTSPRVVRDFLAVTLGDRDCEYFCLVLLDNRHRLIDYVELFRGTIDGASVHPREVVKTALAQNAAAVILVHNHPSGVGEPSQADEIITTRLRDALALVDIRTVDHLIVAGGATVSLAERGVL
jgi:DNA repair protein RadC